VTTKDIAQGERLEWLCELRGQGKEPNIMQSILLSMQGDMQDARKAFDLHASMTLWRLQMPFSKKKGITIAETDFDTTDFGSSIKPFLHQATIDLLSMNDITHWLDIDANNSFVIHLAVAMNKNPLALHTMFARNCSTNLQSKQKSGWTPDVLATVLPSSLNLKIAILEKQPGDDAYTCKVYGSATHDADDGHAPEPNVVLVRCGNDYSWLKDTKIQNLRIEITVQDCQHTHCVKWETLTKKTIFIEGCRNTKREATADWKKSVWNNACNKVGLRQSESGKWLTKPPGFDKDLSFQDGSLTPDSFEVLLQRLEAKMVTCTSVADLGSEAGHAVAQFAFKPFVTQVIGIEIQYAWVAYSAIIVQHLQLESSKQNYYLADIHIIHGNFLNTNLSEWEAALSCADLCFCNNKNWDKGSVPAPKGTQAMSGGLTKRVNGDVANLLVEKMKLDSHVLVFDITSFTGQAYQHVHTLVDLRASWSTLGPAKVDILQMRPTEFKVLKKALQTLCQAKSCNFESLPREWWENEDGKNRKGFLRLMNHVLKQDYFSISNSSVHVGWSVSPPMIVCIKKFPDRMKDADVQIEISILKQVAQNSDTSTNNVIGFVGTDIDRKGGTVLIFEMIDASSFNSDLQTMTSEQIAEYMYRLMQALNYMHTRNIVHRDVKQENFLHNFQENKFRLIDFGSAIHGIQGFDKKGGGTRGCRAPETLKGTTTQTAAVDVWGAGIILLSLITGKIDILSRQAQKIKGDVCDATHLKEIGCIVGNLEMQKLHEDLQQQRKPCDEYGDGSRHENKTGWAAKAMQSVIPGRIDQIGVQRLDQALDLLSKMLNVRPSKRITSQEALNHPFLQSAVNRT
jgi:serine/threonine protein kinase